MEQKTFLQILRAEYSGAFDVKRQEMHEASEKRDIPYSHEIDDLRNLDILKAYARMGPFKAKYGVGSGGPLKGIWRQIARYYATGDKRHLLKGMNLLMWEYMKPTIERVPYASLQEDNSVLKGVTKDFESASDSGIYWYQKTGDAAFLVEAANALMLEYLRPTEGVKNVHFNGIMCFMK